jgi:arylsulfatase A-like enzyme
MDFYLSEDDRVHPLSDELATVAEVFGGRGYRTAGIYANPLLWEKSNLYLHQGFDIWRAGPDEEIAGIARTLWEKGQKQKGKVFLYAHYFGPHTENAVIDGFAKRRGSFATKLGDVTEKLYTSVRTGATKLSDADVGYVRAMYDDATWKMDEQIGRLIETIGAMPGGDRTIWIFTADHGESLLEPAAPPWLGHEAHLHEEMVHVPLLMFGPGIDAGKDQGIAEVIDVAPTLMSLLGVTVDATWGWEGNNLFGAEGIAISERGVWSERQISARDTRNVAIKDLAGAVRCFDRRSDPLQAHALADPAPCKALVEKIDAYVAAARPPARTGSTGSDEETQQMLEALGYKE